MATALVAMATNGCTFELHDLVTDADGGPNDGGPTEGIDPCNLTKNPSFELDTSYWTGSDASLARVALEDAVEGCCAARVSRDASATDSFAIRDEPPSLSSTVAGAEYRATAWVRSAIDPPNPAATVRLILREGAGLDQLATTDYVPLGTTFQKLSVAGVATLDGDLIDVHLTQYQAVEGDAFFIDMVQLVRVADPACP